MFRLSDTDGLDFDLKRNDDTPPPMPRTWQRWFDLYGLAPDLKRLHRTSINQPRPPRCMSDLMFISLCAAFADPTKREILRALILDLLSDDLADLLFQPEEGSVK